MVPKEQEYVGEKHSKRTKPGILKSWAIFLRLIAVKTVAARVLRAFSSIFRSHQHDTVYTDFWPYLCVDKLHLFRLQTAHLVSILPMLYSSLVLNSSQEIICKMQKRYTSKKRKKGNYTFCICVWYRIY